jgi:hypothetical protein
MTQRKTEGQPLGKIPLVVLTNGPNKQKGELAALSENGAVQQVAGSCHELQVCTPHAVIEAIKAVVVSVRNGRQ